jgi:hypothetical protein
MGRLEKTVSRGPKGFRCLPGSSIHSCTELILTTFAKTCFFSLTNAILSVVFSVIDASQIFEQLAQSPLLSSGVFLVVAYGDMG